MCYIIDDLSKSLCIINLYKVLQEKVSPVSQYYMNAWLQETAVKKLKHYARL